jgi:hypothetical protein
MALTVAEGPDVSIVRESENRANEKNKNEVKRSSAVLMQHVTQG